MGSGSTACTSGTTGNARNVAIVAMVGYSSSVSHIAWATKVSGTSKSMGKKEWRIVGLDTGRGCVATTAHETNGLARSHVSTGIQGYYG